MRAFFLYTTLIFASYLVVSQDTEDPNLAKVAGMVSYYKFMLNTVGDQSTPTNEKEIIITNSYQKIFRDPKVQIEDNLDTDRRAIVNKNVQAYLRDVDFFFEDISFEFSNIDITAEVTETGGQFYLVSFLSSWEGINIEGEAQTYSSERFIEVNVSDEGEIEIVSIYSTKVSREQQLKDWWYSLPVEWDNFFREKFSLGYDSVSLDRVDVILSMDSLNLAGQKWIVDIEPLSLFRSLAYLNLSGTNVRDLVPLRYAQNLLFLDISDTRVEDLSPIRYFRNIEVLLASRAPLRDLIAVQAATSLRQLHLAGIQLLNYAPLQGLSRLEKLDLSSTAFSEVKQLALLTKLVKLNLDRTYISSFDKIGSLTKLEELIVSNSYIRSIEPLSQLKKLRILNIDHTEVSDLKPLNALTELRRVYADFTNVSEEQAANFMRQQPETLVITNSSGVLNWWDRLPVDWKTGLLRNSGLSAVETTEEIIQLLQKDSLNLSGLRLLKGTPLEKFKRLRYLDISGNLITNFKFVSELTEIEVLIASGLPVDSVDPLAKLKKLTRLDLQNTLLEDVSDLRNLPNLRFLNLDETKVISTSVPRLWLENEQILVIYRTSELQEWWSALPDAWREWFAREVGMEPDSRALHRLGQQTSLTVEGQNVRQVEVLKIFTGLRELKLRRTDVMDLSPLVSLNQLESIECSNGPFYDLASVSLLTQLRVLDVANTPVDDLDPIMTLKNLEKLDASGTQIKNIKELRDLRNLIYLDVSNTKVWQLHWLFEHPDFKELICYNSRVRDNKLEEFKSRFPDCKVTFY